MGVQSTVVKKLPPEVLDELNAKLLDGVLTLDQLLEFLRTKVDNDSVPSRSALGRYAANFNQTVKHLRENREVARALSLDISNNSGYFGQGRLLVEMMRALAFDIVYKMRSNTRAASLDKLYKLAKILKDLSQSIHFEYEVVKKIRDDERQKVEAELKEKIAKMGKAADLKALSDEELERRIRALAERTGEKAA